MKIRFNFRLVSMTLMAIVSMVGGIYGYLLIVPHSMLQMLGVLTVGFIYVYFLGLLGTAPKRR